MTREFVSYTQALALKELGFDEPCFRHYKNNGTFTVIGRSATRIRGTQIIPKSMTGAPLYQQAFRWFREKHGMHHTIQYDGKEYIAYTHNYHKTTKYKFDTYEEAEQACLDKLIEIVKHDKGQV